MEGLNVYWSLAPDALPSHLRTGFAGLSDIEHGAEMLTAGGLILLLETLGIPCEDFITRVRSNLPEAHSQTI